MKFKGSIIALKASVNASGDTPRRVTLELFGDFAALDALLKKPLDIQISAEENHEGPFDE